MDKKTIYAMKNAFDEIVKIIQEEAVEFWYTRDCVCSELFCCSDKKLERRVKSQEKKLVQESRELPQTK